MTNGAVDPLQAHLAEYKTEPLRCLCIVDGAVSGSGSRLQLADHVARGVLAEALLLVEAGVSDIRIASVRRTDRGVEVLLEEVPPTPAEDGGPPL